MATKLVLETDKREGKEGKVLIEVHKDIINKLKPHQVEGTSRGPGVWSYLIRLSLPNLYYPTEVRRGEYWGLGVFLLHYFPLVNIMKMLHRHF